MAKKTIADVLVELLVQADVKRVWGLPGDSLNGFTEALCRRDGIDWVGVRHEEVAAIAAAGEADAHGGLTACAGSCGPGNLHLINGLFEAQRRSEERRVGEGCWSGWAASHEGENGEGDGCVGTASGGKDE